MLRRRLKPVGSAAEGGVGLVVWKGGAWWGKVVVLWRRWPADLLEPHQHKRGSPPNRPPPTPPRKRGALEALEAKPRGEARTLT
eukprot:5727996-Prymnesium_polylepis.1